MQRAMWAEGTLQLQEKKRDSCFDKGEVEGQGKRLDVEDGAGPKLTLRPAQAELKRWTCNLWFLCIFIVCVDTSEPLCDTSIL